MRDPRVLRQAARDLPVTRTICWTHIATLAILATLNANNPYNTDQGEVSQRRIYNYLLMYLSIYLFNLYLFIFLFIYLFIYLFVDLFIY
jgi:hypothetical protein